MQERSGLLRSLLPWSRMEWMAQVHTHQAATYKGAEGIENNPSSQWVWDPEAEEALLSTLSPVRPSQQVKHIGNSFRNLQCMA